MAIKTHMVGKLNVEGTEMGELSEATLGTEHKLADITPIGVAWDLDEPLSGSWTISGSCNSDPADTVQAALRTAILAGGSSLVKTSVDLWVDASNYYGGSAILTSATITKSVGAVDKFSWSFKGRSALVYT